MRAFLLSSLAVAMLQQSFAQMPASIQRGEFFKGSRENFGAIVGVDDHSIYTFGIDSKWLGKDDYYLNRYNVETFRHEEEILIKGNDFQGKPVDFVKAIRTKGGNHLIFKVYDGKNDRYYLLGRSITNGKEVAPFKVIMDVPLDQDIYSVEIGLSADSTKIAAMLFAEEYAPAVMVFDDDLEPVWKQKGLQPFEGETFFVSDYAVDNQGSLLTVGFASTRDEMKKYSSRGNDFLSSEETEISPSVMQDYVITKIDAGGQIDEINLKEHGKYIHTVKLMPDCNGKVLVMGLYSDEHSRFPLGYFSLVYDPVSLKLVNSDFRTLGEEYVGDLQEAASTDKLAKGMMTGNYAAGYKGLEACSFQDLVIKEDGSVAAIIERNYRTYNGDQKYWVGSDLIVVNLDRNLDFDWISKIPKNQKVPQANYSSFIVREKASKLHFFYNDKGSNIDLLNEGEDPDPWVHFMGARAMMATLDERGTVSYQLLEESPDKTDMLMMSPAFRYRDGEDILLRMSRIFFTNKCRFARISLTD